MRSQRTAKHGYEHHDVVKRLEIHPKRLVNLVNRFVVKQFIEGAPINVESMIAEDMVTEQTAHAAANVVELFVQTFLFQTTIFLDSRFLT